MGSQTRLVIRRLRDLGDPDIAAHSQRFFKTGTGEYGEGDLFLGIRVPAIRRCAREYRALSLQDVLELLASRYHEIRMLALLILVAQYSAAERAAEKRAIYQLYLRHTRFINNWDLVDASAEHIVGAHLFASDREPLHRLARSRSLWERRIAIISTYHFIKRHDFAETLAIAEALLHDREDLIHKAVGWMLREVGNRSRDVERRYLAKHYRNMPRTMLRYAIEKLPKRERLAYLRGAK